MTTGLILHPEEPTPNYLQVTPMEMVLRIEPRKDLCKQTIIIAPHILTIASANHGSNFLEVLR